MASPRTPSSAGIREGRRCSVRDDGATKKQFSARALKASAHFTNNLPYLHSGFPPEVARILLFVSNL